MLICFLGKSECMVLLIFDLLPLSPLDMRRPLTRRRIKNRRLNFSRKTKPAQVKNMDSINCAASVPEIPIDFRSILTLIAFTFQIVCTVHPLTFKLRVKGLDRNICLDMLWGSVICIVFLICTTTIGLAELKIGIIGDEHIQPYAIIIIFFTLAYASISLDFTGLFKAMSMWAADKSKSSNVILFSVFYGISSLLTLFTSNDIVILTLTPIILYYTQRCQIDPVPFLMGQFVAANTWSITLLVGNPTNIIVGTYTSYT